jgi:hypothetical protein
MLNSAVWMLTDNWHLEDIYDPSDNSWVPGKLPPVRTNMQSHSSNNKASTFWTRNVIYMRLKSLDIGYNIPKKYINKAGVQNLRIYANGYNLFSFDNVRAFDIDPELALSSGLQYPQSRIISIGAKITF